MRRYKLFIYFIIIIIIASFGYYTYGKVQKSKEKKPDYKTEKVIRDDLEVIITATGIVKASVQIDIKSEIGGKVISLPHGEGEFVHKGDIVAIIDDQQERQKYIQADADYKNSLAQLETSQASLALQIAQTDTALASKRQEVIKSKVSYEQAMSELEEQKQLAVLQINQSKANLEISQKQLEEKLAGSRKQEIAGQKENVSQAEVNMENAMKEYERQKELYEKDFVAKQILDNAETKYLVAKSQYKSAKQQLDMTLEGNRNEDIEIAKSQVNQAKKNLQLQITQSEQNITSQERALELAYNDYKKAELALNQEIANNLQIPVKEKQILSAEATLSKSDASRKQTMDQLSKTKIISPTDGIIINRPVEIGDVVASQTMSSAAGTTLMTIANLQEIYAEANIDETDIGKIKKKLPVNIISSSYQDLKIPGIISHISPQAVQVEQIPTFKVKIKILLNKLNKKELPYEKNPYELLFPGMSVDADIHVIKKSKVLQVPIEAVWVKNDKKYVTLVTGEKSFKDVEVITGIKSSTMYEIIKGVSEGAEIKVPDIEITTTTDRRPPPP